jgi:hypothetical protein
MADEGKALIRAEVRHVAQATDWYEGSRLLRAAVAALPMFGGSLDLILSGGASARAKRRIDDFIAEVEQRLKQLGDRVATIPDQDGLVDVTRQVLNRVATTRTAEKRQRFANIVLHQAITGSALNDIEDAVELLERLSDLDIAVLTIGLTKAEHELPGGQRVVWLARRRSMSDTTGVGSLSLELPQASLEQLTFSCAKLVSYGLFLDEGVGRLDTGALEYFRPTELASWFAAWICEVET